MITGVSERPATAGDSTGTRRCAVHPSRVESLTAWLAATFVGGLLLLTPFPGDPAEAKRKPVQRTQPELRIVSVTASPESYVPQDGSLDFTIEVQLPRDLEGATILEVSSLISSPSKRSFRFLSTRQPVGAPATGEPVVTGSPDSAQPLRVGITLSWDGTDQTRQVVGNGKYGYEVRAKLLAVSEKGPRTQMVSWPKRGTVEVK